MNYFVKCTGYTQNNENYFTVDKVYMVKDNKITADNGFVYNKNHTSKDVIAWLNTWYKFEKVEFKRGDRVIATDNLHIHKNAPCTIMNPNPSPKGNYWVKFEDGAELYATVHSIIEQKNEKKIVITTDGVKVVTAKLYEDGKEVKTATAKCAPEDTFDFMVGAKLATERLVEPPKPKYYNGKVVCVKSFDNDFTVGKVYEIKDGKFRDNAGWKRPCTNDKIADLSDLNNDYFKQWMYQFIPFVED